MTQGFGSSQPLTTTYSYSALGDLACVQLPAGNALAYTYDAAGRLASVARQASCGAAQPLEQTLYALDAAGHRIQEIRQRIVNGSPVTDATTTYAYTSTCHLDSMTTSGLYYNLNRWYATSLGRYVASDPVRVGKQNEAFVYALARPTRFIDPLGLFHVDSSCNNLACVPQHGYGNMLNAIQSETQAICSTLGQVIYDSALLKCVTQKCNTGKIYCKGADRDPTNACNDANAGGYGYPGGEATFCPGNWTYGVPPGYFGDLAIHEWSHNCGWKHGQGKGVPL